MKSRFSALKAFLPHLFYQVEPALGRLRKYPFSYSASNIIFKILVGLFDCRLSDYGNRKQRL